MFMYDGVLGNMSEYARFSVAQLSGLQCAVQHRQPECVMSQRCDCRLIFTTETPVCAKITLKGTFHWKMYAEWGF